MPPTPLVHKSSLVTIHHRVPFKVLLMVYKRPRELLLFTMCALLTLYQPGRVGLGSSKDKRLLTNLFGLKSLGDRSFSVAGPKLYTDSHQRYWMRPS